MFKASERYPVGVGGAAALPSPEHGHRLPSGRGRVASMPSPETGAPVAVPRYQRQRDQYGTIVGLGILLSVALHFAVFTLWPAITAPDVSFTANELTSIELPPQVEIPPPPAAIARPAIPMVSASAAIDEDITIAPTTFEANPVSELPPPPVESDRAKLEKEVSEAPTFTPYTVAPTLLNRAEAAAAVVKKYPPTLKAAEIGGSVLVWFFIDQDGVVQKTKVAQSSGYESMDRAALEVAPVLRFSPAMNRDKKVPVWVQLPIQFSVRH